LCIVPTVGSSVVDMSVFVGAGREGCLEQSRCLSGPCCDQGAAVRRGLPPRCNFSFAAAATACGPSSRRRFAGSAGEVDVAPQALLLLAGAAAWSGRRHRRTSFRTVSACASRRCLLPIAAVAAASTISAAASGAAAADAAADDERGCLHGAEVRAVDGKGFGVVATGGIAAGDCILREQPLLVVEGSYDEDADLGEAIEARLSRLSTEDQQMFWSWQDVHADGAADKTSVGILRTNGLPVATDGDEDAAGVFVLGSRFNHSCSPNVQHTWWETPGEDVRFALREIPQGQELCISYLGISDLLSPRSERRAKLQQRFGFSCTCEACSLEGEDLALSDGRRSRLRDLDSELSECTCTVTPDGCILAVDEMVQLVDAELNGAPFLKCRAWTQGFQIAAAAMDLDLAESMARQALDQAELAEGRDSPQFALLQKCLEACT